METLPGNIRSSTKRPRLEKGGEIARGGCPHPKTAKKPATNPHIKRASTVVRNAVAKGVRPLHDVSKRSQSGGRTIEGVQRKRKKQLRFPLVGDPGDVPKISRKGQTHRAEGGLKRNQKNEKVGSSTSRA